MGNEDPYRAKQLASGLRKAEAQKAVADKILDEQPPATALENHNVTARRSRAEIGVQAKRASVSVALHEKIDYDLPPNAEKPETEGDSRSAYERKHPGRPKG